MTQKKRAYSSKSRDEQAAKTRSRILKEAFRLFQSVGFDDVTIHSIAAAAEVSMPTIYALFKSKKGVLQALIDNALPPQAFTELVEKSMEDAPSQDRLKVTAKLSRSLYDAERGLMDILRGASVLSPEFKELEQERERRRFERQAEFVKTLDLAKGLPLQKARQILWALTGRDLYRQLVIEQGWSSDAYEKWLADLLAKALLK